MGFLPREKTEGTGKLLSKDLRELCTQLLYLAIQGDPWVKGIDVRCAELHPTMGPWVHGNRPGEGHRAQRVTSTQG